MAVELELYPPKGYAVLDLEGGRAMRIGSGLCPAGVADAAGWVADFFKSSVFSL